MIKNHIKANRLSYLLGSIGALLGAVAGFAYWKLVGCTGGSCPIWSNPFRSTIYGALMGALLFLVFEPKPNATKNQ